MSVLKYRFVSPGVFVHEIDNTELPRVAPARGPLIIGRTRRGPGMRPMTVNSFSEYLENFGDPVPGNEGGDVWRDGNYTSPMYATYAAQAWLRNGQTATIIRLMGEQHTDYTVGSGEAGWKIDNASASFGLFLIDSASHDSHNLTGTLAAVWYMPEGNAITLSGAIRAYSNVYDARNAHTASNATFIENSGADREFTAVITSGSTVSEMRAASGAGTKVVKFNFNPDSDMYVRKVFNTNPILTNTTITEAENIEYHWLGHTFERSIKDTLTAASSSAGGTYGIMLQLGSVGASLSTNFADFNFSAKPAATNWIISQDIRGSASAGFDALDSDYITKLFKFHALDGGEWENSHLKISIIDIKSSPNEDVNEFGSFTVQLRDCRDHDGAVRVLEQYDNCNLNPSSLDFLARRVGDRFKEWDDREKRFRVKGEYDNISKFVRVEMANVVNTGLSDRRLLPFGFWGPLRPIFFRIAEARGQAAHNMGSASFRERVHDAGPTGGSKPKSGVAYETFATTGSMVNTPAGELAQDLFIHSGYQRRMPTSSFIYPTVALRSTSVDTQLGNDRHAYFGFDSTTNGSAIRFDRSNVDVLRALPGNLSKNDTTASLQVGCVFTLDDLVVDKGSSGGATATWVSGSRQGGNSATALSGNYTDIIEVHGFNRFTVPMFGGNDGWDIRQADPVANINLASGNEKTNYVFNTLRRAITTAADPEIVDYNLMVAPGVTNTSITDLMITTCEERGDAMALIDLPNVYLGPQEGKKYAGFASRLGTLRTVVKNFKSRNKNSSYAATYYPWVQIRDSLNNTGLWVPPSVVALGTFAYSQTISELWFAPAGFNRGGLSQGSSGLNVVNVTERLTSENRDDLYEANINPIASFPNEGIVIFGQKTLDATTSALSRINVRRLLIFLKKEISRLANLVLFDQNVEATWGRFKSLVNPVLESVKIRYGLTDYKLVLDETTTTPDLIDRNIMYAKIFLKPARAIEFIALDFIITNTGAAFED